MKKSVILIVTLFWMLFNTSCIKDTSCTPKSVQSEQAAMVNFATANGINATQHSSGLFYEILNPGSGPTPNTSSIISVKYTGKLTDGTVFETRTTPITFGLNNTIEGWRVGIPLIQEGGSIRLIIPSSMAYGCSGVGTIPPDSILYFEIELTDVQ